jgi:hypothetical protein
MMVFLDRLELLRQQHSAFRPDRLSSAHSARSIRMRYRQPFAADEDGRAVGVHDLPCRRVRLVAFPCLLCARCALAGARPNCGGALDAGALMSQSRRTYRISMWKFPSSSIVAMRHCPGARVHAEMRPNGEMRARSGMIATQLESRSQPAWCAPPIQVRFLSG